MGRIKRDTNFSNLFSALIALLEEKMKRDFRLIKLFVVKFSGVDRRGVSFFVAITFINFRHLLFKSRFFYFRKQSFSILSTSANASSEIPCRIALK